MPLRNGADRRPDIAAVAPRNQCSPLAAPLAQQSVEQPLRDAMRSSLVGERAKLLPCLAREPLSGLGEFLAVELAAELSAPMIAQRAVLTRAAERAAELPAEYAAEKFAHRAA